MLLLIHGQEGVDLQSVTKMTNVKSPLKVESIHTDLLASTLHLNGITLLEMNNYKTEKYHEKRLEFILIHKTFSFPSSSLQARLTP